MNENNLTVTIRDMMECREVRAFLQKQYIDEYAAPVISFCMNIPGPVKTNDNILHGFESGKAAILSALSSENININATTEIHEKQVMNLFFLHLLQQSSLKILLRK